MNVPNWTALRRIDIMSGIITNVNIVDTLRASLAEVGDSEEGNLLLTSWPNFSTQFAYFSET